MDQKSKKLSKSAEQELPETEQAEAPAPAKTERLYAGATAVDSDLFKLTVALMIKNAAIDPKKEKHLISHEHTHVFRTYDSSARKQDQSSPVGGHFHVIEVKANPAGGVPIIVSVSKAMRKIAKVVNGSQVVVTEAVPDDDHTHEIQYQRSDKVAIRKMDPEVLKYTQEIARRQNPATPHGAQG